MTPIRLIRGFLTVGLWTLASRVLGFARDIMIAATLGAGPVAEAFFVAFTLPNMFRRFFAEGAFNMAFVPLFAKRLEAGDGARDFARDAFTGLGTVLIVFTVLAELAMPWLVFAMAAGFVGDERFDLAVAYGRIGFSYIIFISLAALLAGVLNSTGRFAAAAAAPLALNVMIVGALILAERQGWPAGDVLIWTVPIAGIAQLIVVWVAAARAGFPLIPRRPRLTPELRQLAILAAPAALAGGVVQVNLVVGRQVASFYDGAIAYLSLADRLYQLPLGVVGIAIGVVLLPELSRRLTAGDTAGGAHAFNRAAEMALALTVPAAVAFVAVPEALASGLYQRGEFVAADARATAAALAIYAVGLPSFVLQKVLQPLYFAREDTKTPFRFALVSLVVNAAVAVGLAPSIGFLSAALATTVAGWVMAACLYAGTRRMGEAVHFDARFRRRLPRILVAAALMGGVLLGVEWLIRDPVWSAGDLGLLVLVGLVSYFGLGFVIGAFRPSDFRAAVQRGNRSTASPATPADAAARAAPETPHSHDRTEPRR
ncbi:murein biosynthesis integral membrane protein MurJ [Mesobaculum littorinae]|uniref:Probable lipid II flippase MurJ n=1 Tax=Mesobaculum littorinae TaxID=2486419 RepID=A0A438AFD3_9RHOB|nr:murein biosynthesis integral membrane protein MurJ [Mesobaculum littorinae]RVV97421.1 murein biosynthesis integral membrane protein MurJ [Mesobaculum littorinae]